MEIYGKEINLRFSVNVACKIAKFCPGHKIENLGKIFSENTPTEKYFEVISKMAVEMHRAYLLNERFESGLPMAQWEPIVPVTEEELLSLSDKQFTELAQLVIAVFKGDAKTTQQIAPQKKIEETENEEA